MRVAAPSIAIDTNILLYAQGAGDAVRRQLALACLERLPARQLALPVQVLGEFHRVLRRKFQFDARQARDAVARWTAIYPTLDTTHQALEHALDLCSAHEIQTWDALILAVACEHRCTLLLSEDMQHGFSWRGVCVVNPLLEPMDPRLAALLA